MGCSQVFRVLVVLDMCVDIVEWCLLAIKVEVVRELAGRVSI